MGEEGDIPTGRRTSVVASSACLYTVLIDLRANKVWDCLRIFRSIGRDATGASAAVGQSLGVAAVRRR